jgi:hypothetical protein
MIVLIIILAALAIVVSLILGLFLSEYDGILEDQLLQEYLDKLGDKYKVHNGQYSQRIEPINSALVSRYIERSPKLIRLVFPYYIEYIGVIPIWSKSNSRIDAMFATGVKRNFKRERLGLD